MAIDIGSPAIDRATAVGDGNTILEIGNPANAAGTITSVFLWANTELADCEVGTFFGAAGTFENRDSAVIGTVAAGSEQTFAGLDIDVEIGDFIGVHFTSGTLDTDTSGGSGVYFKAGDQFGQGEQAGYALISGGDAIMSLNGTGIESAVGNAGIMTTNTGFWGATF